MRRLLINVMHEQYASCFLYCLYSLHAIYYLKQNVYDSLICLKLTAYIMRRIIFSSAHLKYLTFVTLFVLYGALGSLVLLLSICS